MQIIERLNQVLGRILEHIDDALLHDQLQKHVVVLRQLSYRENQPEVIETMLQLLQALDGVESGQLSRMDGMQLDLVRGALEDAFEALKVSSRDPSKDAMYATSVAVEKETLLRAAQEEIGVQVEKCEAKKVELESLQARARESERFQRKIDQREEQRRLAALEEEKELQRKAACLREAQSLVAVLTEQIYYLQGEIAMLKGHSRALNNQKETLKAGRSVSEALDLELQKLRALQDAAIDCSAVFAPEFADEKLAKLKKAIAALSGNGRDGEFEEYLERAAELVLTPRELFSVALYWEPSTKNLATTALLFMSVQRIFKGQ